MRAFAVVGGDRLVVALQRLTQRAQFGIGIRQRDAAFQHRRVAVVALRQLRPRHQRLGRLLERRGGPAEAEQCLVGVQAFQPHALQVAARRLGTLVLQGGEAERHVGLVAQGTELLVGLRRATDLVEQRAAARGVAAAHQRHAEVEARVLAGAGALGHAIQHGGGAGVVAACHQQVGLQQAAVVFQLRRQVVLDAVDGLLGLGEEATLVADLGQVVPGAIAHLRRRALLDQLREDLAGLAVQSVGQQQPAAEHLGLVGVRRHAVEMLRGHQRGDRREVVILEEMEQRVAVVRVLHHALRRQRLGRQRAAGRQQRRERGGSDDPPRRACQEGPRTHAAHCQTLTSNSGCSLPVESLMRSSMYFGSVPFSNFTVAPRL